jgi:hypothetical protein
MMSQSEPTNPILRTALPKAFWQLLPLMLAATIAIVLQLRQLYLDQLHPRHHRPLR